MSDLEPIDLPARIVRAHFLKDAAVERADHHRDKMWDQVIIGMLFAAVATFNLLEGDLFGVVLGLLAAVHVVTAWLALRRRRQAMKRADALADLIVEYRMTRTIKPWPEETR